MANNLVHDAAGEPHAVQRVIEELRCDLRDVRRLQAALEQHAQRTGSAAPYERLTRDAACVARDHARHIDHLRSPSRRRWDGGEVHEEGVRALARQRRQIHLLLEELPVSLFAGVDLPQDAAEVAEVLRLEPRRLADDGDLEGALLLLPTPWLRSVRRRHEVKGHRARARVAARIAHGVEQPDFFGDLLDRHLGPDHLRLLCRVVVAGRLDVATLSSAEQKGLAVPCVWRYAASGVGGALRQLGLVFLGTDAGQSTVYVPSGARPAMAVALAPRLEALGAPGDEEDLATLERLAGPARARRAREKASCRGLYYPIQHCSIPGLPDLRVVPDPPTRLSRIRYRTPGPDRVVELEVRSEDVRRPGIRSILISYQRALGALRETIQLAFAQPDRRGRIFVPPDSDAPFRGAPFRLWLDPGGSSFGKGARDEWAISIREALAQHGSTLHYTGPGDSPRYAIRVLRVHAPEHVESEPRVLGGTGVDPHGPGRIDESRLGDSLDTANLLLERLS